MNWQYFSGTHHIRWDDLVLHSNMSRWSKTFPILSPFSKGIGTEMNRVCFGGMLTSSCILQRSVRGCNKIDRINTVIIPHSTRCWYIYIYTHMVFFSVMSTNFSQFVAEVQAFPKTMPCCRELSESTSMVWLLLISVSQDRPRICVLHQNHCRWAPWDVTL